MWNPQFIDVPHPGVSVSCHFEPSEELPFSRLSEMKEGGRRSGDTSSQDGRRRQVSALMGKLLQPSHTAWGLIPQRSAKDGRWEEAAFTHPNPWGRGPSGMPVVLGPVENEAE